MTGFLTLTLMQVQLAESLQLPVQENACAMFASVSSFVLDLVV